MMRKKTTHLFVLLTLAILLAACGTAPSPELIMDIPDKPDVIRVGVTSALAQLETEGSLYSCAQDVEVIADVLPWVRLQNEQYDVTLVYGEGDKTLPETVYQIGESPLIFIVNPDLPIQELSLEQIQAIYTNNMTDWVEYAITSSYMGEIKVWGYMDDTEIMQHALASIGLGEAAGQWSAAPTTAGLIKMVAQDQNAIGIIPAFALTDEVIALTISDAVFDAIPVLAAWMHEPTQAEQDWLLCVQSELE